MRTILATIVLALSLHGQAARAQAEDNESSADERNLPSDVAALVAEIDAFGAGDQSADPAGDLEKIAVLRRRVEANGRVPDWDLGNLDSAEGAAHFYLRNFEQAAALYARAAALFESGNAPLADMAGLYNNRAAILASMGRYDEAEKDHLRALAIRQEMEGARGPSVASSLFGLGFVYYRQGRIEHSLDFFRQAAEQQLEFVGPENALTIIRLTSLAAVLGRAGREAEALATARQAAELARENLGNEHPTYAIAVNNLGNALVENRMFGEAIPVLRYALDARLATIGENASGTALTIRNLATALKATGSLDEAEVLNRRALAIYEGTGEVETPFALAFMYSELADFAARRGEWEDHESLSRKAISLADAALDNDNSEQAQIHLNRAEWLLKRGETADALEIAERWVPVMQDSLIESHKDRLRAELLLARLRGLSGMPEEEFVPLADRAIDTLIKKLGDVSVSDLALVREADAHREAAILYLAIASDLNDAERGFRAMQLANISELSRGQQFATENSAEQAGALAQRDRLLELSRATAELRARLSAAEADGSATEALTALLAEASEAERSAEVELREEFPNFVARYRPQPVPLDSVRKRLREDDVLIAPVEGDESSWIISVRGNAFSAHTVRSGTLRGHISAIREGVDGSRPAGDAYPLDSAHSLFAEILPDGLDDARHLLVYGGHALATVPFAALTTEPYDGPLSDAPWLARAASVQVVANLSLLGTSESRARPEQGAFLGIGGVELPALASVEGNTQKIALAGLFRGGKPDASTVADLDFLPQAAGELKSIAELFAEDRRTLMIGPDAAEDRLKKSELGGFSVIAFATHGLVSGEIDGLWEPALLLGVTGETSEEDGLLGASEIARLDLHADWVILSACNTALGSSTSAPPFSGLATAFAQAGAQSLLLSHWRVRDDVAARMSVDTIRGAAAGLDRAEALRRAQLALIEDPQVKDGAHPAIWAPFVLVAN